MTLIVEDGGGHADANAYVSVAEADEYFALRGNAAWAAAEAADKEAAIVRATDYLDAGHAFRGVRASQTQALAWPRLGAEDDAGRAIAGVPEAVRRACAELALRALAGDLLPDAPRGGGVKSESVGPLSVTYADGAPAGTVRAAVDRLLRPVVRAGSDVMRA